MTGLYERAFGSVLFPAYETLLRRRKTLRYLREYEANQWLSPQRIGELQWGKLKRLVQHCWEHVPYYREQWKRLDIAPQDIRGPADYARLPVLTKQEVRENLERLVSPSHREGLLYKNTGGSTGQALKVGYTREVYERRMAVMWRGYGWAGARPGKRTFYLWGGNFDQRKDAADLKKRLYDAAFNRMVVNGFLMDEADMHRYAMQINRFRPEIIVGYTTMIARISEWAEASGFELHRPQALIAAAEPLHDFQRPTIERAFRAPIFNTYGCREFMLIAAECPHRNGLHVNDDHLRLELENPLPDPHGGVSHDAVITDLHNYGLPLLRYHNGDMVTVRDGACPCGRGFGMIERIDGRRLDVLYTGDGRALHSGYVTFLFLQMEGIRQFQIVQKDRRRLDISLVTDGAFGEETIAYLRRELAKAVGDGIEPVFHFVDSIPLTPSGKVRVTVSELA